MGSAGGGERMIEFISQLPTEYQEVEYIESSGTQYIDTGFVVNKSDNYVLEIDGLFPSQAQAYQGCNGYMQFFVGSKYGISNESSISVGNRDTVRIAYANQTATLTVNGSQAESKSWASYSGADVKLGILRMGDTNNGWFNGGAASGTIYGYKVWKDEVLVSDCIPCVRNSDNVAGVYDVIREQFITNAGSGVFAVGADSNKHAIATITPGGVIPIQYALRRRMMASMGSLFPPIGTPLSDWTWEQIIALSNSGRDPRNYFSVGDEKDLILTTGEVVPVVIGDFYHNTITGTSTKAPIAFTFKNCLNTTYSMNGSRTNSGGWDGSAMRNTNMPAILNTFPAELIADGAIKYVDILASAGSRSTSLVTSSDRLRLHSIAELGLSYSYAVSGEGTKYAYYTSGNRVKTVGGTASRYWTRSPSTYLSLYFCNVSDSGSPGNFFANAAYGVACGFDI